MMHKGQSARDRHLGARMHPSLGATAGLFLVVATLSSVALAQDPAERPVSRASLIQEAIAKNPGLRSVATKARATEMEADSEGRLPAPEAEVQIWQIPIARPYAANDAQMIMVGVRQPIPAPGVQSARAEAKRREADVDRTMAGEREREIIRELSHAYVDYAQAYELAQLNRENRDSANRIASMARARLAGGGSIVDLAGAEVQVASIEADIAMEEEKVKVARAKINGLLIRDTEANLGLPEPIAEQTLAEAVPALVARAQAQRPEIRVATARQAAILSQGTAMQREADWPMMSVGALYFAPTGDMSHAYGVSLGASLPWIWGKSSSQTRALHTASQSSAENLADARARIASDVSSNAAMVRASERKIVVLRTRVVPAVDRALRAATSGYESSRGEILMLLSAQKAVVETQVQLATAKAELSHAMVELEWAVGGSIRTSAISVLEQ